MPEFSRLRCIRLTLAIAAATVSAFAQTGSSNDAPTNDAPNNYNSIEGWAKLPEGRSWGSTSAVEIDKDGKSIWVAERCGANGCLDRASGQMSTLPPVLEFDSSGKLVKSFGEGMLIFPHGIFVDREGNVWVTDGQDDAPQPQRGAAPAAAGVAPAAGAAPQGARSGPAPGSTKGHQVYKFSPDGKLLMTLGKPGGAADSTSIRMMSCTSPAPSPALLPGTVPSGKEASGLEAPSMGR